MEKARIVNGNSFGGIHQNIWLENNKDIIIAGQLVSDWELTEILPIDLMQPFWNGSQWIESITEQELQSIKQNKIDELNKLQFDELAVTDWYLIRKLDIGTEIPLEIINQRNEIRAKYNE